MNNDDDQRLNGESLKLEKIEIIYDDFKPEKSHDGRVHLRNSYLNQLEHDTLYHLALSTKTHDFKTMFGDVRFVCMGGTVERMRDFAGRVARELDLSNEDRLAALVDLTQASNRYSMFKVGPVLSISVTFFRIGTCGGIGLPPGSVVISDLAVNELLQPFYELHILGKIVRRPTIFDEDLVRELECTADSLIEKTYTVKVGHTMSATDFYEAQTRLDGAICNFTIEDKQKRLNTIQQAGVLNIEMEATVFASMCRYTGIRGAVVCVTLVDRMKSDQIDADKSQLKEFQQRPQDLIMAFIKMKLKHLTNNTNGSMTNGQN